MTTTEDAILYSVADGVATIQFNTPQTKNSLTVAMLERLARLIEDARADRNVRAILLTGSGDSFCAGANLKGLMASMGSGRQPAAIAAGGAEHLHQFISGLYRCPKPVVSAVNGVAAGAGVGIALAGDIVWATDAVRFKLAYTAIGLGPDGSSTWILPRVIGLKHAAELLLTNRTVEAEEALQRGLVTRLLPDDQLAPAARELALSLAQGPTRAYGEVKRLLRQSLSSSLETQLENESDAIRNTVTSKDFAEGVMAFVQKRPPVFQGR